MKTSTRRGFLNGAATAISGVVAGSAAPPSLANAAPYDADAIAAEISAKLFAEDGLARPIPRRPLSPTSLRGSTAPWFLAAAGNITSLGIAGSSMAFMNWASISTSPRWSSEPRPVPTRARH
jgi:hypothetical protein